MSVDYAAIAKAALNGGIHRPTEWMSPETARIWPDIRLHIAAHIRNQPRTLQTEIGPSELGTQCLHHLGQRLMGRKPAEQDIKWLPFIGTSVHAQFERMFGDETKFETETRVDVGEIWPGRMVSGSIDLWSGRHKATIDWKIVGKSTLDSVRRDGPSQQYRIQASLYGIGMTNRLTDGAVEHSCIYYLPRNAQSIDGGYIYETGFDPQPGMWALNRARLMLCLLDTLRTGYGNATVDDWIDCLPRNPQHCFTCSDTAKHWHPTDDELIRGLDYQSALKQRTDAAYERLPDPARTMLTIPQENYQPTNPTIKGE